MSQAVAKTFGVVWMPLALLASAALLQGALDAAPWHVGDAIGHGAYLAAVVGVALCARFSRSRAAFALVLVALGHWIAASLMGAGMDRGPMGQVAYAFYAVFLPVNMAFLALQEDRGFFTDAGLFNIGAIAVQVLLVAFVATGAGGLMAQDSAAAMQQTVADWLHARAFPKVFDAWTWLPQPALFTFPMALGMLFIRAAVTRQPMDAGMFGALAASGLALHSAGQGVMPSVFFLTAGVIVIAAVMQDSYRMAFRDELTGLPGRRALMADLKKLGSRYVIAMTDVDHFKRFNDTWGHDVGDEVLRMVAGRLERVSGGGRAYRYGGEEFTVLFPGRDVHEAWPHLEALRASVEHAQFHVRGDNRPDDPQDPAETRGEGGGETVSVTISIGVGAPNDSEAVPETVIKSADQALYRAKEGGRNRVSE